MKKTIRIVVHLNHVTIVGGWYSFSKISKALSFKVPGCEYSDAYANGLWDGMHKFVRLGRFPSGLLPRFLNFCKQTGIEVQSKVVFQSNRELEKQVRLHGVDNLSVRLRDYQIQAVKIACSRKRGLIRIPTGGGKTLVMVALINVIMRPTLILVSKQESLYDVSDILKKELMEDSVGIVGGGIYDPKIFDVGSIQFIGRNSNRLKKYLNTKAVIIVDEAHHSSAKTWYDTISKCSFAVWKIGLTATPSTDPTAMMTEACLGPVIYSISSKTLIENKFLTPPEITMVQVSKLKKGSKKILGARLDYKNTYAAGIERNDYRNDLIGLICKRLVKRKEYPAILTKTKEHIRRVARVLERRKIEYMVLTGSSSVTKRLRAFREMREEFPRVIIFSTIFDEAIDIPALKAIIIAGSGKSLRRTIQQMGRGMRIYKGKTKVRIFDFFDTTHGYLQQHSKKRKRTYEREGYEVPVMTIKELKRTYLK